MFCCEYERVWHHLQLVALCWTTQTFSELGLYTAKFSSMKILSMIFPSIYFSSWMKIHRIHQSSDREMFNSATEGGRSDGRFVKTNSKQYFIRCRTSWTGPWKWTWGPSLRGRCGRRTTQIDGRFPTMGEDLAHFISKRHGSVLTRALLVKRWDERDVAAKRWAPTLITERFCQDEERGKQQDHRAESKLIKGRSGDEYQWCFGAGAARSSLLHAVLC